jgi:hypothetical protein
VENNLNDDALQLAKTYILLSKVRKLQQTQEKKKSKQALEVINKYQNAQNL